MLKQFEAISVTNALKKMASALALAPGIALGLISQGCSNAASPTRSTGEFAISGTASVFGTVLDSSQTPLDSFQVAINVPNGGALYFTQQMVTTSNRTFAIVIERRAAVPVGDSLLGAVTASSLRSRDRKPDGSGLVVSVPVWLRFALPPAVPVAREVTVITPIVK